MAEHTRVVDIDAPPEIVFEHLVTPKGMVAWMGQHAELDATPGGTFAVDIDGSPVRGEFLEVDPPHRVVVSWGVAGNDELPPGSSRVELTLTATERGTRLELVHSGLPESRAASHARGWAHFLPRLQAAASGVSQGTPTATDLFEELAAQHLDRPGVSWGRMMTSHGLKVNGKFYALVSRGQLVVKVPAARAAELRDSGRAVAFEPGPGRVMKEWVSVAVPASDGELEGWRELMDEAYAYLEELTTGRRR